LLRFPMQSPFSWHLHLPVLFFFSDGLLLFTMHPFKDYVLALMLSLGGFFFIPCPPFLGIFSHNGLFFFPHPGELLSSFLLLLFCEMIYAMTATRPLMFNIHIQKQVVTLSPAPNTTPSMLTFLFTLILPRNPSPRRSDSLPPPPPFLFSLMDSDASPATPLSR